MVNISVSDAASVVAAGVAILAAGISAWGALIGSRHGDRDYATNYVAHINEWAGQVLETLPKLVIACDLTQTLQYRFDETKRIGNELIRLYDEAGLYFPSPEAGAPEALYRLNQQVPELIDKVRSQNVCTTDLDFIIEFRTAFINEVRSATGLGKRAADAMRYLA